MAADVASAGQPAPVALIVASRRFACLLITPPPGHVLSLLMAEWMIAFVWGRARCRGQAHDCVICARQLFGDNTVLPHYESHTVNLTKSYSLGLGPGEGGCKGP